MKTTLRIFTGVVFVAGILYAARLYQGQLRSVSSELFSTIAPCTRPISYRIGFIDPRFGLSTTTAIADMREATALWDDASGRELFAYDQAKGVVTVNFTYDSRQATAQQLAKIGVTLNANQASYDAAKAQYDALHADYTAKKASFTAAVTALQAKEAAYKKEVASWNARGGAPPDAYARLQQEKSDLAVQQTALEKNQADLNDEVASLNTLAASLNQLAGALNLNVAQYNTIGSTGTSTSFEEGVFERSLGAQSITIFQYASHIKLVRVLAHEFGHALGLEHVSDRNAIMYPLNDGKDIALTPADTAALAAVCHIDTN